MRDFLPHLATFEQISNFVLANSMLYPPGIASGDAHDSVVLHILLMLMLFLLLAFGVTKLEYRKSEKVKNIALNKILHPIIRVFP